MIVLKRGLTLHGRMVDTTGRPVRGETVNLCLDLHKHSHTGAGGEIFEQQTTRSSLINGGWCKLAVCPQQKNSPTNSG